MRATSMSRKTIRANLRLHLKNRRKIKFMKQRVNTETANYVAIFFKVNNLNYMNDSYYISRMSRLIKREKGL